MLISRRFIDHPTPLWSNAHHFDLLPNNLAQICVCHRVSNREQLHVGRQHCAKSCSDQFYRSDSAELFAYGGQIGRFHKFVDSVQGVPNKKLPNLCGIAKKYVEETDKEDKDVLQEGIQHKCGFIECQRFESERSITGATAYRPPLNDRIFKLYRLCRNKNGPKFNSFMILC